MLSVNVSLSRKASKDYQSTGVSINVTAELDQSLLARPEQLRRRSRAVPAGPTLPGPSVSALGAPASASALPATSAGSRTRNSNGQANGV